MIPEVKCAQYATIDTARSLAGANYTGADGSPIPNLGERTVEAVTESGVRTKMKFQVCPVTKALGSVSKMVQSGHRVVFDSAENGEGSYIQTEPRETRHTSEKKRCFRFRCLGYKPRQPGFGRQ